MNKSQGFAIRLAAGDRTHGWLAEPSRGRGLNVVDNPADAFAHQVESRGLEIVNELAQSHPSCLWELWSLEDMRLVAQRGPKAIGTA